MRVLALLLAGVLSGAGAHEIDTLRSWIAAVEQHRAGQTDEALATITAWNTNDIEVMRPYIEALLDAPLAGNRDRGQRRSFLTRDDLLAIRELLNVLRTHGDFDGFRRRAAMLHTDAALLAPPPETVPAAPTPDARWARGRSERKVIVKSFDGRFEGIEYNNPHWDVAMDALDALPAQPRDAFVGDWYATLGTFLVQHRRYAEAMTHFDRARPLAGGDPRVLYSEARLHMAVASPRIQNFVRVTSLGHGMFIEGVESAREEFRKAEALLQKALAADAQLTGARLRLGFVLMQQHRWDEGLRQIQQVEPQIQDAGTAYYADLFAGDAQLALGRHAEAQRSFERALASYPDSQSARLGLSAAIAAAGDRDNAIAAILPTVRKEPKGRAFDDPWWIFYDSNLDEAHGELERLREPFTRPLR